MNTRSFIGFLAVCAVPTAFTLLVYVSVQQTMRSWANDPQIQMAEDASRALEAGGSAQDIVGSKTVDGAKSLAPFLIVFDDSGKITASSLSLDTSTSSLPSGVFDYVRQHAEDRITWQPAANIRIAAVVRYVEGAHPGFVLAGRSLREVEDREQKTLLLVAIGWSIVMVCTMVAFVFLRQSA